MRTLALMLALAGCSDRSLVFINTTPDALITSPVDGEEIVRGTPFVLVGRATDAETPGEELLVQWATDRGPLVGDATWSDGEATLAIDDLPTGPRTLILTVADAEGDSAEDRVDIVVFDNAAPQLSFTAPDSDADVLFGDPVTVTIAVSDDRDRAQDLVLAWEGASGPAAPNSDGTASTVLTDLSVGAHDITVTATDSLGLSTQATLGLFVTDGDVDDDGFISTAAGGTDCDDGDPDVFPGAPELCNDVDDDCDNTTDESNPTAPEWFLDDDDDGFGAGPAVLACSAPPNHVANSEDCDDTRPSVNPEAVEVCNNRDDDCDDEADEAPVVFFPTWRDRDEDGTGDPATRQLVCELASGFVTNDDDCDDDNPNINERINEDGDPANACTDCNDGDNTVYPGAPELCDGLDNDCNDSIPASETTNNDNDAFVACDDCNDDDPLAFPGAIERCNGVDDSCDGQADAEACDCPVYQAADGTPYQFCEGSLNWGQAFDACGDDYELVSIETSVENAFLRGVIASFPWDTPPTGQSADDAWWTGGFRDTGSNGEFCAVGTSDFEWLSGADFTYSNWRATEPNSATGCEGCVEIWLDSVTGEPRAEWNDEDCGQRRNYICEGIAP